MSYRFLGANDAPADAAAPPAPPKPMPVGMMVGWAAAVLLAAGMFYGATSGVGMKRLAANKRRSSRRSSRRHTSRSGVRRNPRRTGLRRYKALSPTSRKRMPDSSFALDGRRWPIVGPPGSSRERNKWQALQAIRYLNMGRVGSQRDYLDIRNAIIRRYGQSFWRSYDGPSWAKVEKAKRSRRRTRRTSGGKRRLAANPYKSAKPAPVSVGDIYAT